MYQRDKSIRHMPDNLRPREKMLSLGADKLSDEELLAIILGSGVKDRDVLSLSEEIMKVGWRELYQLSPQDLMKRFKGIGIAKACQIKALVELAKRINEPYEGVLIKSPETAYKFVREKVDERKEYLISLYLSPTYRLISIEVIAIGRMNALNAEPKEILYHAINTACYGLILVHNHPKGDLKPSREDIEFTKRVKKACDLMGFELVDHIIVNSKGYLSMRREGYME
ncbi:MAG: RadC family protein [Aquificaceae bacterium]